ncbi:MAG: PHP domain-containing protein [Phycisphaeraceae bacterium]|nr:PHP domain-containing protein [Phycisphaeraceae bacterium]
MSFVDLHCHSTASDGTIPPEDLPALAVSLGLSAIAMTDHDTTCGVPACKAACETAGIDFVPGIEISADPGPRIDTDGVERRRGTLHLLGLFVRHDDPELAKISSRMREARNSRNPAIIEKLQALGVRITYDEVLTLAQEQGTQVIGRPHIAQLLVAKSYAKSLSDAFTKYLKFGAPAFLRRDYLSPAQAIDAIHHAGGLAILAHPVQLVMPNTDELEHAIKRLADIGLDGIETRHCDHTPALTLQYEKFAQRFKLLTSGGSDFHGDRKTVKLGSQNVPRAVYEQMLCSRKQTQ